MTAVWDLLQIVLIMAVPAVFAITVHEVAHGWVAWKLGDGTAREQGRLSLNPLRHVDPIGTVLVPALLVASTGYAFGWARPVPVNWTRLGRPKRDMVYVAAAGPAANLLMALGWALLIKLAYLLQAAGLGSMSTLVYMGFAGILVNAVLMVLNLIPIPPLDGGRVLTGLLPLSLARRYARLEPFGLLLILALMLLPAPWTGGESRVLHSLLCPPVSGFQAFMAQLAGSNLNPFRLQCAR